MSPIPLSRFVLVCLTAALLACGGAPSFELTGSVAEPEEASSQGTFGGALSAEDGTMVVGSRWGRDQAGAAYVFEASPDGGWTQTAGLVSSMDQRRAEFGSGVAVAGDVVMVGAPMEDLDRQDEGAVYVFERGSGDDWSETDRLTASTPELNAEFGTHVALAGDRALIASPFFGGRGTPGGFRGGAVHAFERGEDGQWLETAVLQPTELRPDIRYGLRFGFAIDFNGDRALIGADPIQGDGQNPPGSAYVFDRGRGGEWSEAAVLTVPGAEGENRFGTAVALSGDVAVVGARGENEYAGGAHIFERGADGGWAHTAHLVAPDTVIRGNFGHEVVASDSTVVVFAMASGDESSPGHAYVYARRADGWSLVQRLVPSELPGLAGFGDDATLTDDRLVVAGRDGEGGARVFIFGR